MIFSLRLNNDLPVAEYVTLARVAEAAGFDQFWVSNDLFLRSAPVILAAVAVATRRIGIGTCILNPYTIHPGEIAMMAATLESFGDAIADQAPMKRIGRPDDMAGVARFLASRAGAYVTGAIIPVDGGLATVG